MRSRPRWRWLGLALLSLLAISCGKSPESSDVPVAAGTGSSALEKAFTVKGVVREVPPDHRTLVIRHEEIPGYMPRMTMELTLLNPEEATNLTAGDEIEFRLVARSDDHFIDRVRRLGTKVADAALVAPSPVKVEAELRPGDELPDFGMLMEDGKVERLAGYRGKAVAFTFFFTRCPLPDFCPRMNKNLAEARKILAASSEAPTNWMILSVSFDAEFDRPAVLALHAKTYRGEDSGGWRFGAMDPKDLTALAPRLDLLIVKETGSFSHNLRTVVVDTQGRIFKQFDGNQWTADELADAIRGAATGKR
jgi:protein SCO1/2